VDGVIYQIHNLGKSEMRYTCINKIGIISKYLRDSLTSGTTALTWRYEIKAEEVAQRIPTSFKRSAKKFTGLNIVTSSEIGIREATEYPKITECSENVL
jgi:hypothetical protein